MGTLKILGALAVVTASSAFATISYPKTAQAQTPGMDRRDDRQDTRQTSRDVKQACKAGDENSRPECRQGKRDTKQAGRQGETPPANPANPAKPATGAQP
ncbi:hypothetical protein LJR219_004776 [Phenylobacterium sp. LjRoot219]|uniref:hypothetical protein n=1 Tax=Phenylobacterium sp. LjRoot219 TaxID=3342283 RepID=UPI003ED08AE5